MLDNELFNKLLKASEEISKKSIESSNYIIVSPKIYEIIENLDIKKHRKKKLMKINNINKKTSE